MLIPKKRKIGENEGDEQRGCSTNAFEISEIGRTSCPSVTYGETSKMGSVWCGSQRKIIILSNGTLFLKK